MILEMEILTDPVTIHLMMMVLVTSKTMKIPMMMKTNQTSLMLLQHQHVMFEVKEMVLEPRSENLTRSMEWT